MNDSKATPSRHFLIGVLLVVVVQTVCMVGGYLIERHEGCPVTGVPSAFGLSLVFMLALLLSCHYSQYVMLGSFSLAFLAPLILFLGVQYQYVPIAEKLVHYSLGYMVLLICLVWSFFLIKIIRKRM